MEENKLIIYCDGGSRGNPGPSAIGVVIGERAYAEQLGELTNNAAEYQAVIFALKKAKQLLGKKKARATELEVKIDSELLYKQMNAEYKILDKDLQPLFVEIWNLKQDFKKVHFRHLRREQNKEADQLVNCALDSLF